MPKELPIPVSFEKEELRAVFSACQDALVKNPELAWCLFAPTARIELALLPVSSNHQKTAYRDGWRVFIAKTAGRLSRFYPTKKTA